MHRPALSICIPTRNRRLWLARHLRHIASFKDLDYEVVVFDNCSEDDTAAVVEAYREELKSVVYVRQQTPLSSFESQMAVMNSAGGRYAICTSDDDFVVEEGLIEAVRRFDADPTISEVYGAWEGWLPDGEECKFKAIAIDRETRVGQRDLIHWYLNAATPELPIVQPDILEEINAGLNGGASTQTTAPNYPPGTRRTKSCMMPWDFYYVFWNGDVPPCCIVKDTMVDNVLGKPMTDSINSAEMMDWRRTLLTGDLKPECETCTYVADTDTKTLRTQVEQYLTQYGDLAP